MDLATLGLSTVDLHGASVDEVGRVCGVSGRSFQLWTSIGREDALLPAATRAAVAEPVVGDWVLLSRRAGQALLVDVLPRRTTVRRMSTHDERREQILAANVDVVFVCFPARKVSPYLVESLLGVAVASGADPTLVVTKIDSATARDHADMQALLAELNPAPAVVHTSAVTGSGVDELASCLQPHRTGVFLGASGVGKSTITNALLGGAVARTGRVKDTGEGRHTTTRRELFVLPSGGVVIDTPGLRSVTPALDADARERVYGDVAELASECRFSDCRHLTEPGCAVRAAVAAGEISAERVERERRMERETRRQQPVDKRIAAEEHRKLVVRAKVAKRRRQARG